jgi:hypothetical protein
MIALRQGSIHYPELPILMNSDIKENNTAVNPSHPPDGRAAFRRKVD